MNAHIDIDIGGTQMRAASYPHNSQKPLTINRISSQGSGIHPKDRLIQLIESICPKNTNIHSIGIAVAGSINLQEGSIQKSTNIPEFDDFPVVHYLTEHFDIPVFLGNDANLSELGEWKYGAGQGFQELIYMTISMGIGGGVSKSMKFLKPHIQQIIENKVFDPGYIEDWTLTPAALGDDAGLQRALALARDSTI